MVIAVEDYTLLRKLGQGQFSTVWLAMDNKDKNKRGIVALKISRCGSTYEKVLRAEAKLIRRLNRKQGASEAVIDLLDESSFEWQNNRHYCFSSTPMAGTLWTLLLRMNRAPIPIPIVLKYTKSILTNIRVLH